MSVPVLEKTTNAAITKIDLRQVALWGSGGQTRTVKTLWQEAIQDGNSSAGATAGETGNGGTEAAKLRAAQVSRL